MLTSLIGYTAVVSDSRCLLGTVSGAEVLDSLNIVLVVQGADSDGLHV